MARNRLRQILLVYEQHASCAVAHDVAISYMHAVTQDDHPARRPGRSVLRCSQVRPVHDPRPAPDLQLLCFNIIPKRTRGLVRCT